MRYFQIPSYPVSRNKYHKRGLPAHDSILNLYLFFFSFFPTQAPSQMIQAMIYKFPTLYSGP